MALEINDEDGELLKLAKKLFGGKNRIAALKLAKAEEPTLSVPELEQREELETRFGAMEAENKKLRDEIAHERSVNGLKETRRSLKEGPLKASDEEITAAEKIMVDRKIGDHATAIEFIRMNSTISAPSASQARPWDKSAIVPMAEKFAKGNVDQIARQEAAAVIDELRGIKR